MEGRKVLLVVAQQGYQGDEYSGPKSALEAAGFTVVTASDQPGVATADDNSTTAIDITLDRIKVKEYEGIYFIGGSGAMEHLDSEQSYALIRAAMRLEIPIGAICISTRILAKAGALQGKLATGWDGDGAIGEIYKQHGAEYTGKDVTVDGIIVTAIGPRAAREFGAQIVSLLQDVRGWG